MNENKMRPNGDFHFHKGHYLASNITVSLYNVQNENYTEIQCNDEDSADFLYTNSWIFLHGSCNLFALALHDEFGYEVYEIRDKENHMRHVFCKSLYQGQEVYIDVRGITTDIRECLSEFRNDFYNSFNNGVYQIFPRNIEEDIPLECEGDKTGYLFAKSIIKRYRQYYDL